MCYGCLWYSACSIGWLDVYTRLWRHEKKSGASLTSQCPVGSLLGSVWLLIITVPQATARRDFFLFKSREFRTSSFRLWKGSWKRLLYLLYTYSVMNQSPRVNLCFSAIKIETDTGAFSFEKLTWLWAPSTGVLFNFCKIKSCILSCLTKFDNRKICFLRPLS